jgi:hypothetical protein
MNMGNRTPAKMVNLCEHRPFSLQRRYAREKGTGHLERGNSLIFQERGFNSSATRGE